MPRPQPWPWLRAALDGVRGSGRPFVCSKHRPPQAPTSPAFPPATCTSKHTPRCGPCLHSHLVHSLAFNLETQLHWPPPIGAADSRGPRPPCRLLAGVRLDGLGDRASWLCDTVAWGTATEVCARVGTEALCSPPCRSVQGEAQLVPIKGLGAAETGAASRSLFPLANRLISLPC